MRNGAVGGGGTCLIDRARECLRRRGVRIRFSACFGGQVSSQLLRRLDVFLMDQLSIITRCDAKYNADFDTCHNLLLG